MQLVAQAMSVNKQVPQDLQACIYVQLSCNRVCTKGSCL